MTFKKLLLIHPDYKKSHYEYIGLPAGLGYISEALDRVGIEHQVFDMALNHGKKDLENHIISFRPDLIGISMMSFRYKDHYDLADFIKRRFPGIIIVAGGPHVSTFRERTLRECKSLDYGVTLEGEDAIKELCLYNKEPKDIKGLLYRKDGGILYTGDREFNCDLDNVPFPRYRHFDIEKYPAFIPLLTSRGCPYNCIFCPVKVTIGNRLRSRSPGSVLDEIEYWYKEGIKVFNVVDDNFSFYKDRVLKICEGIGKRGLAGLTLSCRNGLRADTVDRKMLIVMKEAGFNYLAFGVESGSEKMLKIIKKGEALTDIENAIRNACNLGYMVTLFFIVGLPHETEEDVNKSLKLALRYPVFDVRFYNPIPFPGTELYEWVKENKCFKEREEEYLNHSSHWINRPIFETKELPVALRKRLYCELNNKARKHTLKTKMLFTHELEKLFSSVGIPRFMSKTLSRLYYTNFFQKLAIESGIAARLKTCFIKRGRS